MPKRHRNDDFRVHASLYIALAALMTTACVTKETHTKTLGELEAARKMASQQEADLDALKKRSQAEADRLKQQLSALQQTLDQESSSRKAA